MSNYFPPWMLRAESKSESMREGLAREYDHVDPAVYKGRAPFSQFDPNLPPHPFFNAPPPREMTGAERMEHADRLQREQAHCVKEWDEAVALIKAKHFTTRKAVAEYFGKHRHWGEAMVRLMIEQHVFSEDEIKQLIRKQSTTQRSR